jgi:membrane dipeptidase
MINLVGVDHVGMGLDQIEKHKEEGMLQVLNTRDKFGMYRQRTLPGPQTQFGTLDDAATIPYAIPSVAKLPDVTRGLVARGYSDQDILKILGNNWMRIFKKILR